MNIADRQLILPVCLSMLGARFGSADDRAPAATVILRIHAVPRNSRGQRRYRELRTNPAHCLPVIHGRARVEHVDASNHLVTVRKLISACTGAPVRDKKEEIDDVFRLSLEVLSQCGSCVAIPTEQVLRWHLRIMMQP